MKKRADSRSLVALAALVSASPGTALAEVPDDGNGHFIPPQELGRPLTTTGAGTRHGPGDVVDPMVIPKRPPAPESIYYERMPMAPAPARAPEPEPEPENQPPEGNQEAPDSSPGQ